MRGLVLIFVVFGLLATSCTKEDAVEPCNHENAQEGTNKDGYSVVDPNGAASQGQAGVNEPGTPKPDPNDISDDGEDLSDSEKARRKPR